MDSEEKVTQFRTTAYGKRTILKDTKVFKQYRKEKLQAKKKIYDSLPVLDTST